MLTNDQNAVINFFYGHRDQMVPMRGAKEWFRGTDVRPSGFRRSAMRLPVWSRPTVTSRHPRTGEARRASCLETNRQVATIRRMPCRNAVIDGFYGVALEPVARRWMRCPGSA